VNDEREKHGQVLDDVLRRMTTVDDVDAEDSAARVLLRVRTQPQASSTGARPDARGARWPIAAMPRLAWAAMVVCVLAGSASWFAMRPTPSTSQPAAAPSPTAHAGAMPAPVGPAPAPASAPAPVASSTSPSPPRALTRLPAPPDEGEGARLPRVDPIAVASIAPAPLPAPSFLTTTPVASESIEVEPIAVTPLSPSAQEPREP
jgi:hypothetical protein